MLEFYPVFMFVKVSTFHRRDGGDPPFRQLAVSSNDKKSIFKAEEGIYLVLGCEPAFSSEVYSS
jgi:hypothetical protein